MDPVLLCFWCLSTKGALLHLRRKLYGLVVTASKSKSLTDFLKLKNLADEKGLV